MIKAGDKFRVMTPTRASGVSKWARGYTGDFECLIPEGTLLVAEADQAEGRSVFLLVPEDYAKMEEILVPQSISRAARYEGYYFVFGNQDLDATIKKV